MISLVDSELKQSESDDSSDGGAESRCSNMKSFFEPLCRKSENTRTGYNIVQRFLDENTSSAVTAEAFFFCWTEKLVYLIQYTNSIKRRCREIVLHRQGYFKA